MFMDILNVFLGIGFAMCICGVGAMIFIFLIGIIFTFLYDLIHKNKDDNDN